MPLRLLRTPRTRSLAEDNQAEQLRGKNADIWGLIFTELQSKLHALTITKVKSHTDGNRAYHRQIPFWQIARNELADLAADV